MTFAVRLLTLVVLALTAVVPSFAQGQAARPPITTLAGDVQEDWTGLKTLISNAANAMPEDKYSYKSTPAQRDFGAQVMHIVQVNQMLLGTLGAKTPAPMINMQAKTKAEIAAAVRQSFEWCDAVVKEFSDAQLVERIAPPRFMGPSASRIRVIGFAAQHTQDIYGQMVVYLRLNGVTPPASVRPGV
ncbi:MAG: DinB family protein [Vicinamibacterales bacterium]